MVQRQLEQIVLKTLSWKNPSQKKAGGVDQSCRPCVQTPVLQKQKTKQKKSALQAHVLKAWSPHGLLRGD
jgi:hypothetical protein